MDRLAAKRGIGVGKVGYQKALKVWRSSSICAISKGFTEAAGTSMQQAGGFLQLLQQGHGGGGRVVPNIGAQARQHHGAHGMAGLRILRNGACHASAASAAPGRW
jgi:hypothetical protein